ncbi:MAG TPA: MarR family transcriptional regulator [Micromonosporaceae bacterium]|jgi:DNA-binding MarR family transcriptional regulator|nr:MarR family transcriptional regulator [Micromonosporaceae bacterium]
MNRSSTLDGGASITLPDDDLAGRLYFSIARLVRMLRRGAPVALSLGSITALGTVVNEGPIRVGDLAALEGVRAPTMTRIVDGLVADGYAERVPDPADGRACLVRATPAGADMLAGARSARARVLADSLARLSPRQRASIGAALPAIEALFGEDSTAS